MVSGDLLTSVDRPAGTYLLVATVQVGWAGGALYSVKCRLVADGTLDESATAGPESASATTALQAAKTSATPFTAQVRCHDTTTQSGVWRSARISAIEVGALG